MVSSREKGGSEGEREREKPMKGVKGLWSQTKASGSFSTGSVGTLEFRKFFLSDFSN